MLKIGSNQPSFVGTQAARNKSVKNRIRGAPYGIYTLRFQTPSSGRTNWLNHARLHCALQLLWAEAMDPKHWWRRPPSLCPSFFLTSMKGFRNKMLVWRRSTIFKAGLMSTVHTKRNDTSIYIWFRVYLCTETSVLKRRIPTEPRRGPT